jgi:hypothetical protein
MLRDQRIQRRVRGARRLRQRQDCEQDRKQTTNKRTQHR